MKTMRRMNESLEESEKDEMDGKQEDEKWKKRMDGKVRTD